MRREFLNDSERNRIWLLDTGLRSGTGQNLIGEFFSNSRTETISIV